MCRKARVHTVGESKFDRGGCYYSQGIQKYWRNFNFVVGRTSPALTELNLAIQALIAKVPILIPCQYLHLYDSLHVLVNNSMYIYIVRPDHFSTCFLHFSIRSWWIYCTMFGTVHVDTSTLS